MSRVSVHTGAGYYQWGNGCEGWILADTPDLSVKQERMPPGTAELLHYHEKAQQFFYILHGEAVFEVEGKGSVVRAGEGFHIPAGVKHRIINHAAVALEFVLSSQPSTNNDRINWT